MENRWRRTFFEIWAFPYREIQRKTAGGGNVLRFGHFPIAKCKGKPPRRENFEIGVFPYREIQRKTAGGGKLLRFGHFPIGFTMGSTDLAQEKMTQAREKMT